MRRDELTAQLTSGPFDLLIIGGGIVGAGIARDAAMRGLKVALIERDDFASGASSKTSKLIHGGLRYLEHGHLSLVRESLRERRILRSIAPTVVKPLQLLLPIYRGDARPAWKIHFGLWIYGLLVRQEEMRVHGMVSATRALELDPRLQSKGLVAAGAYTDGQMDDARLCLFNVLDAIDHGAVCCNYVHLRQLLKANGRVCGGVGEDRLTGQTYEIRARVVVNATGPWGDGVRRLSEAGARNQLVPTKGIHLVLPRTMPQGVFLQARSDQRMMFMLPWNGLTLVGTTESPVDGPLSQLRATAEEVDYLLGEVNAIMPGMQVTAAEVITTFAGARPLLGFSGQARAASREHRIVEDRSGLVSVMGGKYTTYRRMAAQTLARIYRRQHWTPQPCQTDQRCFIDARAAEVLRGEAATVAADVVGRLLRRHGVRTVQILRLLNDDRSLAAPLCVHHDYLAAEAVHAIQQELASSVTDLLARRLPMAFSACQGVDALPVVCGLLRRYAKLSEARVAEQEQAYRLWLADGLAFREAGC